MTEEKEKKREPAPKGVEDNLSGDFTGRNENAADTPETMGKGKINTSKGSKKRLFLFIPLFILIITVISIKFPPSFLNGGQGKNPLSGVNDISGDDLSEEALSPFFIPPSNEPSRGAVRIDFSVIWDGLASIRFSKRELKIRDGLSKLITDFAAKEDDLKENIPLLEQEISAFLRKVLDASDLAIKIKEIRYI